MLALQSALLVLLPLGFLGHVLFYTVKELLDPHTKSLADEARFWARPLYVLSVVVDLLTGAFFPALLQSALQEHGWSLAWNSSIFLLYYVAFAVCLVLGPTMAQRLGGRYLLVLGAVLSTIAMVLPVLYMSPETLILHRVLSGLGQGWVMVAVQAMTFYGHASTRAKGAHLIVYGFNGGMVIALGLGAGLGNFWPASWIFALGGVLEMVVVVGGWYVLRFVPHTPTTASSHITAFFQDLYQGLHDRAFVISALGIGIPAKAIMSGVVFFALPLVVVEHLGVAAGGMVAFYALGVLCSSGYATKACATIDQMREVLRRGVLAQAFLLAIFGMGSFWAMPVSMYAVLMAMLGLAHGLINAPIVAYTSTTPSSERMGPMRAATSYRFFERLGHVVGPLITGVLLSVWGLGVVLIFWALVSLVLGFGFLGSLPNRANRDIPV